MPKRLLTIRELGLRERRRRRCVVGARLPESAALELARRAKAVGVTRSRFITEIVLAALGLEGRPGGGEAVRLQAASGVTKNQIPMITHHPPTVRLERHRQASSPCGRGIFPNPSTPEAERIRRARSIAVRMSNVVDVLRLDRAARLAGLSRHAFALAAIEKAVAAQLSRSTTRFRRATR